MHLRPIQNEAINLRSSLLSGNFLVTIKQVKSDRKRGKIEKGMIVFFGLLNGYKKNESKQYGFEILLFCCLLQKSEGEIFHLGLYNRKLFFFVVRTKGTYYHFKIQV